MTESIKTENTKVTYTRSTATMMDIREMIDECFGDENKNKVNFRLLKIILLVMAKTLGVLQRDVNIEFEHYNKYIPFTSIVYPSDIFKISEINVKTVDREEVKKTKRRSSRRATIETQGAKNIAPNRKELLRFTTVVNSPFMKKTSYSAKTEILWNSRKKQSTSSASPENSFKNKSDLFSSKYSSQSYRKHASMEQFPNTNQEYHYEDFLFRKYSDTLLISKGESKSIVNDQETKSAASAVQLKSSTYNVLPSSQRFLYKEPFNNKTKKATTSKYSQTSIKVQNTQEASGPPAYETEKIIIVEFSTNNTTPTIYETNRRVTPQSLVTKEQFYKLSEAVKELQNKFADKDLRGDVYDVYHKRSTMTQPISVVKLSARLETIENKTNNITDLLESMIKKTFSRRPNLTISGHLQGPSHMVQILSMPKISCAMSTYKTYYAHTKAVKKSHTAVSSSAAVLEVPESSKTTDNLSLITSQDLRTNMGRLRKIIINLLISEKTLVKFKLNKASEKIITLDRQLDSVVPSTLSSINNIEAKLPELIERANKYDSEFMALVIKDQEELHRMQNKLGSAIEYCTELHSNTSSNIEPAIKELRHKLITFYSEIEHVHSKIDAFQPTQLNLSEDLKKISTEIDYLNEIKENREDLKIELCTKASLEELNQYIDMDQYMQIYKDICMKIDISYKKFNSAEEHWQEVIERFLKLISEKADKTDLVQLEETVTEHLLKLHARLDSMLGICGKSAPEEHRKQRHLESCISCNAEGNDYLTLLEKTKNLKDDMMCKIEMSDEKEVKDEPPEDGAGDYRPCRNNEHMRHIMKRSRRPSKICCWTPDSSSTGSSPSEIMNIIDIQPLLRDQRSKVSIKKRQQIPCRPCNQLKRVSFEIDPTKLITNTTPIQTTNPKMTSSRRHLASADLPGCVSSKYN